MIMPESPLVSGSMISSIVKHLYLWMGQSLDVRILGLDKPAIF